MPENFAPPSEPLAQVFERHGERDFALVNLGGPISKKLRASLGRSPPVQRSRKHRVAATAPRGGLDGCIVSRRGKRLPGDGQPSRPDAHWRRCGLGGRGFNRHRRPGPLHRRQHRSDAGARAHDGQNGALKAYLTRDLSLEQAARLPDASGKPADLAHARELDESKQPGIDTSSARIEATDEQVRSEIASFRGEIKSVLAAVDRRFAEIGGEFSKVDSELALVRSEIDGLRDKVVTRIEASDERVKSEISSFQGEVQTRFAEVDAKFDARPELGRRAAPGRRPQGP